MSRMARSGHYELRNGIVQGSTLAFGQHSTDPWCGPTSRRSACARLQDGALYRVQGAAGPLDRAGPRCASGKGDTPCGVAMATVAGTIRDGLVHERRITCGIDNGRE